MEKREREAKQTLPPFQLNKANAWRTWIVLSKEKKAAGSSFTGVASKAYWNYNGRKWTLG